jgi:hypothetical protein
MLKDPTFTARLRWFAGELLVVIVGVLIAVALNGRFEASKSHERETGDLQRLSGELRETEVNLEAKLKMMRDARRGATALLRGFSAPGTVTRDSLVWWARSASGTGGTPGLTLGIARSMSAGRDYITDDSLRSQVWRLVELAEAFRPIYQTNFDSFKNYATSLRSKISTTEVVHEWWVRDSVRYINSYGPNLPFLPGTVVPFAVVPASFFRDHAAFTAVDGLFDTSEDAVFLLTKLMQQVRAVRESVDQNLKARHEG